MVDLDSNPTKMLDIVEIGTPDLSPAAALFRVERVAREQQLPVERVREFVAQLVEPRTLGFLGEPRVNVLRLNLALDALDR